MTANFMRIRHLAMLLSASAIFVSAVAFGQNPQPSKPQSSQDVVRVFTELVQTDVMVFDKQGHFVDGLTRDNFEIKIDGQARPIQFFEQVKAGTSNEEAQLAAARGSGNVSNSTKVVPLDRGRTVFFFIDDFHLDHNSFLASKKAITNFIDQEMGQNDQVEIATATVQTGFLQQLTSDQNVLHLALDRLNSRTYSVTDSDRPPMNEYESMLIDNNDIDFFEYMVDETLKLNPGAGREFAASIVRNRAHVMLNQGAQFNANTLFGLERLVRDVKDLPGRKILFFFSNGFLLHNRRGDAQERLQRITSAAAKSGVVIYAVDAGGLSVSSQFDASQPGSIDMTGRRSRAASGQRYELQDGMNAMSRDTGGRPIFNTNDFKPGITNAIKETSVYYLLAWKPDSENQKSARFRNIQVNVVGRPDLTVRVRKGFFDVEVTPAITADASKPVPPVEENKAIVAKLRDSIVAPFPQTALPIQLGVNYYDSVGKGATLATSVLIPGEFLVFEPREGKVQAVLDVRGVYFNDKGEGKAEFYERLVTTAPSAEDARNYHGDITYTYPANLPPGLYQVRVAVHEYKSGRTGSAHSWIEVPDLSRKKLSMSSLLLGERTPAMMANTTADGSAGSSLLSAGHRFHRESTLRFVVFVYNAAISDVDQKPDIAVQVQVIRDDQPVLTTALRKVSMEGLSDMTRIPYAAEIPMSDLRPGRYVLQVTLIDRVSKQSNSQQTHFDIY
jgi:VWFA-related protein